MAKTKARDIVAEIAASIPESTRQRPWWLRLNEEQKDIADAIFDGWKTGKLGKHKFTAAKAISGKLAEFGIRIGYQGVVSWLDSENK